MNKLPPIRVMVMLMVGACLVGAGIVYWAHGAATDSKVRYEALEKEVPNEGELQKLVAESQTKVDATKLQLQHLEQAVPGVAYVPTLLTELEQLGKAHNIVVTGVRPVIVNAPPKNTDDKTASTEKKKAYQEMSIDITGRGSYDNVMQVVEALKKFPKVIAIETVGLTPKKESGNDKKDQPKDPGVVLDASIRIKAYLFPTPQAGDEKSNSQGATS